MLIYNCEQNKINISEPDDYYNYYIESGFLLLKKYEIVYAQNLERFKKYDSKTYAHPFEDKPIYFYRGTDREGPGDFVFKDNLSFEELEIVDFFINKELFCKTECKYKKECEEYQLEYDDSCLTRLNIILDEEYVKKLKSTLKNSDDYEIVFVKAADTETDIPKGYKFAGFDISYSRIDLQGMFSIICDCLFIPMWHGCDENGTAFMEFFNKLNKNGLFNDRNTAFEYLKYYNSFDWAETGNYAIYEIYLPSN